MLDGRIAVGDRLPAERQLAGHLALSRTTVSAAYTTLREAGYLASTQGSGSVARLPGRSHLSLDAAPSTRLDLQKAALPATPYLADAAARAVQQLPAHLSGTGFDPVGLPVLRAAIADRYAARGLATSADQIMVTVGAQHAITLLARVLVERGDRVLVESPSYPHAYEALREAGGRFVTVPVTTEEGWDVEAMEQSIRRASPSLAYLMPDFQNPTGRVMPPDQRERMLQLAADHGTTVVADETMAELSIDEVAPRLPLAAHGPAVLIGSVGKTVWGGVRIGWIRAEPTLISRLVRARPAIDLGTPILEQLIAADLLGSYDLVLADRRERLRAGRDALEHALATTFPTWRVPHVTGGLTTWVGLGAAVSSQLVLAARAQGLLLAAGPLFGVDGAFERFLRIPFTSTPEELPAVVEALDRAWNGLSRHPVSGSNALADVV